MMNIEKFIDRYEQYYFDNREKYKDIVNIVHTTSEKTEKIIEEYLKKGEINLKVVLWKAGRLSNEDELEGTGEYILNGYGNHINKGELCKYLNYVQEKQSDIIANIKQNKLLEAYNEMNSNVPKYFGSVYIINLMYFISKGIIPIYDKYAHIAVKALFANISPSEVYVGPAPNKNEAKDVINMYKEYIWLLEKVFGKSNIERRLDRALWVYGHAKEKYIVD